MKVKELIELLGQEDADALVILQIDKEGNGYYRVDDIRPCIYNEIEASPRDVIWDEDETNVKAVIIQP